MSIEIKTLPSEEILSLSDDLNASQIQPLYFIRGLNSTAINQNLLEALSQKAGSDKNLCFRISQGNNSIIVLGEALPWDSDHFGINIGRVSYIYIRDNVDSAFLSKAIALFLEQVKAHKIDYLTASLDVRKSKEIASFSANGFSPIEFRAHYHTDLRKFSYPKRFKTRLALAADLATLEEAAANTQNPFDRFFGDPCLCSERVKELMRLWIRNSVTSSFADGAIVPDMTGPKAFCTFKTHKDSWNKWGVRLAQPILAAVAPDLSGWYVRIMSELSFYLKEQGADAAYMTTQLANLSVIRTWEALNYNFGGAEVVLRWKKN